MATLQQWHDKVEAAVSKLPPDLVAALQARQVSLVQRLLSKHCPSKSPQSFWFLPLLPSAMHSALAGKGRLPPAQNMIRLPCHTQCTDVLTTKAGVNCECADADHQGRLQPFGSCGWLQPLSTRGPLWNFWPLSLNALDVPVCGLVWCVACFMSCMKLFWHNMFVAIITLHLLIHIFNVNYGLQILCRWQCGVRAACSLEPGI